MATNRVVSQDTFDDAPDITPRPRQRSPEATRSLTDRRPSSTSTLNKERSQSPTASRQTPEGITMAENGGVTPATTESNGDKKSPALNAQRISLADMDEVNLEEGQYTGYIGSLDSVCELQLRASSILGKVIHLQHTAISHYYEALEIISTNLCRWKYTLSHPCRNTNLDKYSSFEASSRKCLWQSIISSKGSSTTSQPGESCSCIWITIDDSEVQQSFLMAISCYN